MVIIREILKDCYKHSNPSQFRNLTVIDYSYWPKCVVIHTPLGYREYVKSPNTHRLEFRAVSEKFENQRISKYYGLNYNSIVGERVNVTGYVVVIYKHGDPIFLNCWNSWYSDFWTQRPSRYQCEMINRYTNLLNYNYTSLLVEIKKLKKGETLESKYGVKTKFVMKLIKEQALGLLRFQQKYRKGMNFYKSVVLTRLLRLFNSFGNEPYFKQIYNYASNSNPWSITNSYCDYMNMCNKLVKAKHIKEKDWPVAPAASNVTKVHDKITPIYNRYLDTLRADALKTSQKRYTKNYYQKAKAFEAHNCDFSVIACKNLTELITEGRELHHCVGSYTDSVSNGKEYVLFLRRNTDIDKPFYTIDVTPEGEVRQIHGAHNCEISDEIKGFVNSWIKEFKLSFPNNKLLCHL